VKSPQAERQGGVEDLGHRADRPPDLQEEEVLERKWIELRAPELYDHGWVLESQPDEVFGAGSLAQDFWLDL
jgi:hypothetical protein